MAFFIIITLIPQCLILISYAFFIFTNNFICGVICFNFFAKMYCQEYVVCNFMSKTLLEIFKLTKMYLCTQCTGENMKQHQPYIQAIGQQHKVLQWLTFTFKSGNCVLSASWSTVCSNSSWIIRSLDLFSTRKQCYLMLTKVTNMPVINTNWKKSTTSLLHTRLLELHLLILNRDHFH